MPGLRLLAPWVLHLTVPPWILPLHYHDYAGVAKIHFCLLLSFSLYLPITFSLPSPSALLSLMVSLSQLMYVHIPFSSFTLPAPLLLKGRDWLTLSLLPGIWTLGNRETKLLMSQKILGGLVCYVVHGWTLH